MRDLRSFTFVNFPFVFAAFANDALSEQLTQLQLPLAPTKRLVDPHRARDTQM